MAMDTPTPPPGALGARAVARSRGGGRLRASEDWWELVAMPSAVCKICCGLRVGVVGL